MIDDRVFTEVDDEVEDLGGETTIDLPPYEPVFGNSVIKDEQVVYYEDAEVINDYFKYDGNEDLVFFLEIKKEDNSMRLNLVVENSPDRYAVDEINIISIEPILPNQAGNYQYTAKQGDTDNLYALIPE